MRIRAVLLVLIVTLCLAPFISAQDVTPTPTADQTANPGATASPSPVMSVEPLPGIEMTPTGTVIADGTPTATGTTVGIATGTVTADVTTTATTTPDGTTTGTPAPDVTTTPSSTPLPTVTGTQTAAVTATGTLAATATGTPATEQPGIVGTVVGEVVISETVPFNPAYLDLLQLPPGFSISVFAENLGNARWMLIMPDGTIFLTRREQGDVIALVDANADGVADQPQVNVVASDLPLVHGIAYNGNFVYLATDTSVYRAEWLGGAALGEPVAIITDLPTGGQHPNRTLGFAPDGSLFITIGSTCNACRESDPENATILRAQPDGSAREIYAMGLRNTIGFGWHPLTGELWGMDHGSDWRGNEQPPEELNHIMQDQNYGWPWCYADQQPDLFIPAPPPGGIGRVGYCQLTTAPALTYTAHSAPIGMVFYTGAQFPSEYTNDAFVAMRGSWNRNPPSGYEVVHIAFDEAGQPVSITPFITGWLLDDGRTNFGRIAGLAIAADGSLLIAEDQNGIIYRVTYTGSETATATVSAGTETATATAAPGSETATVTATTAP